MAGRGFMQWAANCRTVRLDVGVATSEIIVLGQTLCTDLSSITPESTVTFHTVVGHEGDITVSVKNESPEGMGKDGGVTKMVAYISVATHSSKIDDKEVNFLFVDKSGDTIGVATLRMTAFYMSLDVDCDRDGVVEKNNPNKGSWQWGPDGHGAILLVNNDCDDYLLEMDPEHKNSKIDGPFDLEDMSRMAVRVRGPETLPEDCRLRMWVRPDDKERLGIFNLSDIEKRRAGGVVLDELGNKHIIGPKAGYLAQVSYDLMMVRRDEGETLFAVEGLKYPDKDFNGTLRIHLSLLKNVTVPVFEDTVIFRMAPWIMTPNTLEPIEAFTCQMKKSENLDFINDFKKVVEAAGIKVNIVPPYENRGDRWMQDEIELGYSELPGKKPMPVVLDSPRDRGLQKFPKGKLLGPDFGYVTRYDQNEFVNSLDSFGNLEVSPPVKVDGRTYPMGRILLGSAFPTTKYGRRMMRVVRDFLYAQQVQPPVELFSDWLGVGHIDEFMTFVPAAGGKGFRLLLASPSACYNLLRKLKNDGHGDVLCFEGKTRSGESAERSISDLLDDSNLKAESLQCQNDIDWNRDVMKRELGLDEGDIIDLPQLFQLEDGKGAGAYFPDMVNMIVLGKQLGIPKPFGPMIDGACAFETNVRSLLEPLGLTCHFVNDWDSYHLLLGEVHCGSNTRRKPFDFKWWNMKF
ncbi:PADI2 [Branchiostoma lanceolatum]|uniref:protein-arginine deiminase n=1 Tax=Branchiostoma lanceolatum TaxID=7740 RepID=A0A8J9Z4D0_BRALA|nr:PADI2 [Branchiostoma lanceolatum]